MHPWNLDVTKSHVVTKFGEGQAERLWNSLQSIHRRQNIAGYHFYEYKRLLSEKLDPVLAVKHPLELILTSNDYERNSYYTLHLQVLAHVLACMQSMHALGDTLAYTVAYSLGLNRGDRGLKDSEISIASVVEHLECNKEWSSVHKVLNSIHSDNDFKYLSDVVNHSKHRSIIPIDLHFDATGESGSLYELKVPAFQFRSRNYQQCNVDTFLADLYAWLLPQIIECGHALNITLSNSQA